MTLTHIAALSALLAALPMTIVAQGNTSADVEKAFHAIDAAIAKHDLAAFESSLADNFTFVNINGELLDKARSMERHKAGKLVAGTPNEIMKTQVMGDTAIVTYKTQVPKVTIIGTRVFVKKGAAWKWVYSQGSVVADIAPR